MPELLYSADAKWRPVFCSVTADMLYTARSSSDVNCIDYIPLVEVTSLRGEHEETQGGWHSLRNMVRSKKDELKRFVASDSGREDEEDKGHEAKAKEVFKDRFVITIQTEAGGHNAGRKFRFKIPNQEDHDQWMAVLEETRQEVLELKRMQMQQHPLSVVRDKAKELHDTEAFQQFFGFVIMASFLVSLVRAEIVPLAHSRADDVFEVMDLVFTALFTCELLITFVAHFFLLFWQDAWRIFDTIIVVVSLVSASGANLPAGIHACICMCACVCVCVRARACVCVCVCVCALCIH